jgi:hypothetical protein
VNVDIWEIIGAIATALSLLFAIYTYMQARSNRITETAKLEIYKERLRTLHYELNAVLHSTDAIVQLSKQDTASVDMLQTLARIARGQLYTVAEQLREEQENLGSWRYGQMIETKEDQDRIDVKLPDQEPK